MFVVILLSSPISYFFYKTEWNSSLYLMLEWGVPIMLPLFIFYSVLFFRKNYLNKYYFKWWVSNRLFPFFMTVIFGAGYINFANCYFGEDSQWRIQNRSATPKMPVRYAHGNYSQTLSTASA
jgi:hypothetical protein